MARRMIRAALRWGVPLAAAILAVAALWLALDNPDIDGTSRGNHYTCLAPWDTVLNGADNFPGGEPPRDGDRIAERCRAAGYDRFHLALGSGFAALVLLGMAVGRAGRGNSTGTTGAREPGQAGTTLAGP